MMEALLVAIVFAPGVSFLLLGFGWLAGWTPPERFVARLTATVFSLMTAGTVLLAWLMYSSGTISVRVSLGEWFRVGDYHFLLAMLADRLSVPMVAMTTALGGIAGVFSERYVHRDAGFFRFFLLLHLFAFGALAAFTAGSVDLLIGGWELVGVTSVLLIAFFTERPEPARNAIRVFASYRIADIGLLLASFVLHHGGSTLFTPLLPGEWPDQVSRLSGSESLLAGFLLLMAASGKSAQGPFAGWLPRAMEGPTPSSSIFYGAVSIHLGAYLLLRFEPILRTSLAVSIATVGIGLLTALLGTVAHRVATDVKTSLAYASMTQLGVIFMEIGFGFPRLALLHIVGHAVVRTLQLLRAPSMLHDHHKMHAAAGGELEKADTLLASLPVSMRLWLYRFGLDRGFYDACLDRLLVVPILKLSRLLGRNPIGSEGNAP